MCRGDDPLGVDQSAAAEEVVRGAVLQPEERHPGVLAHLETALSSVYNYNVWITHICIFSTNNSCHPHATFYASMIIM